MNEKVNVDQEIGYLKALSEVLKLDLDLNVKIYISRALLNIKDYSCREIKKESNNE